MNIVDLLRDATLSFGKKAAIIEQGTELSYKDLWCRINDLAAAFQAIGIKEKYRVSLILSSDSNFVLCLLALLKLKAIVTPLNPNLTVPELQNIFNNLNPHAIITLPAIVKTIERKAPQLAENKIIILASNNYIGKEGIKYHDLNDLCRNKCTCLNRNFTSMDDGATINYTYRGIGYPLGAVLTHNNYIVDTLAYSEITTMSSEHRILSFLPLYHVYPLVGCILAPLVSGATIVIASNYMPRSILEIISTFKINYLTAVPSMYKLLLHQYRSADYNLNALTRCIVGGAYVHADLQDVIGETFGADVMQGYGLTECLAFTWSQHEYSKKSALGLPLKQDFKIKIVDDNSELKARDEVGEIVISGPTVMSGYYGMHDETQEYYRDNWLYTGDYGYLDGSGRLYFEGLKKNVAKVGGNLVDLKEVENVLISHPFIDDVSVYAEEDDLWGHVVAAAVVSSSNGELNEMGIKAFCSERLSRYKIPKRIDFRTEVVQ